MQIFYYQTANQSISQSIDQSINQSMRVFYVKTQTNRGKRTDKHKQIAQTYAIKHTTLAFFSYL